MKIITVVNIVIVINVIIANPYHLVDIVVDAIHVHVDAHVEEVLVIGGVQGGGDHGAVDPLLPQRQGRQGQDPGHLNLELHVAVLVEVPVEAVLVVLDGG